MELVKSKKRKQFHLLQNGELFEYEGSTYLKTESVELNGLPDCYELGTGEKLFLSPEKASEMKVFPLKFPEMMNKTEVFE